MHAAQSDGSELAPQHAQLLRASAITPDVAAARGYRTVTTRAELRRLGFSDTQARVPVLLIPVWNVHGEIGLYQARPDTPRIIDGKALKYETPKGAHMLVDVPPQAREMLADPRLPLFVTEGARKADAAVSQGLCCIDLLGVWNWRGTNDHGGKVALADWEAIALNERDVFITFDSDAVEKRSVHAAMARLKGFLESRGAHVRVIYLPPGPAAAKVGLDDFLAAGGTVEQLLAFATDEVRSATDSVRGEDIDRPTIQLAEAQWNTAIRQAADAVGDDLFMRDSVPMLLRSIDRLDGRTIEDADDVVEIHGVRHRVGSLVLVEATAGRVRYQLDERVQFTKFNRHKETWVPTRCHSDIAGQVVANAIEMGFRPCAGIVHVPLFVDGEIITTPGWHRPSGLILDVGPKLPTIATQPTRADAERALTRLLHPFRGFCGTVDHCALAASALTAVLRPSLRTAPATLLDGNGPGVGKGLLARTLTIIATGGTPAVITEGHNAEETEKRIAAALLSGVPVILLDNLQRHVASSALESALTEGTATIRSFGTLTNLHVPCRALILLTANNATLRRDMLRRTLPVRIVVPVENPEARQFDFDPLIEAREDRGELVAAALTIVRAWWHVRELPEHRQYYRALGSFPQWAQLVAAPVAWLVGRNPIWLIEERKAQDQHAGAERALIEEIAAQYQDHPWKAAEVAEAVPRERWADAIPRLEPGAAPSSNAVGYWLRQRRDRVFGRWILRAVSDRNGVNDWCLKPAAGDAGHAGDVPPGASGNNGANSLGRWQSIPPDPPHPPRIDPEVIES